MNHQNSNNTQNNNKTHNRSLKNTDRHLTCINRRPCYRDQRCDYCLNRRIGFICNQVHKLANATTLSCFLTISLPRASCAKHGLKDVMRIRRHIHKYLKTSGPYLSVVAIGVSDSQSDFIPHIHTLCGLISKEQIELCLLKKCGMTQSNIFLNEHRNKYVTRAKKRVGYMIKQNYRPTLFYKDKSMRLITASRGLHVSRPTRFKHMRAV